MAKMRSISVRSDVAAPHLNARNVKVKDLKGAVSWQDLNKRPTAVPLSKGRSMRGGKR